MVDGLIGAGLKGPLSSEYAALIEAMNRLGKTPSCWPDIPSGLCGSSGLPKPVAVRADLTVTFHAAKLGCALPHAAPHVGTLDVRASAFPGSHRRDNRRARCS